MTLSSYIQSKRKLCEDRGYCEMAWVQDARTTVPKLLEALERAVKAIKDYKGDIGGDETKADKALADIERILEVKP